MLKRNATGVVTDAELRRRRWQMIRRLIGAAAVVLAAVIVWALFVPGTDWLARHDIGSSRGSLAAARDAARGRLLTLGAGLLAAGALLFTGRTFNLSRRTFELTEQGQVTDRYTKAIDQLGSGKLDVRIGGIYALERIARDSAKDHPTVMEVLLAFIWEHAAEPWPESDTAIPEEKRVIRPDIQAALTVVGRRDRERDLVGMHPDFAGLHLNGAKLTWAKLDFARLTGATLIRADLTYMYLGLRNANLTDTDLTDADLRGVKWPGGAQAPEGWMIDNAPGPDSGRLKRAGQLSEVTAHYL